MERKIGLSSLRARSNASAPHGYHSTGLSLCWRRYGECSAASRLGTSLIIVAAAATKSTKTNQPQRTRKIRLVDHKDLQDSDAEISVRLRDLNKDLCVLSGEFVFVLFV